MTSFRIKSAEIQQVVTNLSCRAIFNASQLQGIKLSSFTGVFDGCMICFDALLGEWTYTNSSSSSTGPSSLNDLSNVSATGAGDLLVINQNVFIGENAGGSVTSATGLTFVGFNAGAATTSGGSNTFLGQNAGSTNIEGEHNTFIGKEAGTLNDSGSQNTFIGSSSGIVNSSGQQNTAGGYLSGASITTGEENTFYGASCGSNVTTTDDNTFIGSQAGFNSIGSRNTIIGQSAGSNLTTGDDCIIIGQNSDVSTGNAQNRIAIGTICQTDNTITIGNDNHTNLIFPISTIPGPYTDNNEAILAGVPTGAFYYTSADPREISIRF